jgi:hypothetical protein
MSFSFLPQFSAAERSVMARLLILIGIQHETDQIEEESIRFQRIASVVFVLKISE